ncbi:MAG: T9SS type A sorting domain-containing protein [Hymenobacter sp.]|nr:T9SS type A sorting domain-containing protein [Hymenobacter sp.]
MFLTLTRTRRGSPAFRGLLTLSLLLLCAAFGPRAFASDFTVAKDGTGDYTTVQAAINAAPAGRTAGFTIFIKNGRYKEKLAVPASKPFLQLVGESVANTILTYDDGASTMAPGGGTLGTQNSASFSVNANDFSALNLTFENSFGDGSQAVAVLLNADRAAFKNCRFLGNQDTLYTKGNGTPLHYFRDCYLDGNVDFIFGSSVAVFDRCVVYAKTRLANGTSYITAANTPPGQTYGYVFRDCKLPANTGGTQYVLGRPWQNSTGFATPTQNKVVFLKARLGAGLVQPAGWAVWDAGTNTGIITYAEYQSRTFSGNLAPVGQRVGWSRQLGPADTAAYTVASVFGNAWSPCAAAGFCGPSAPEIAVSNFRAAKGSGTAPSVLSWNISWAMSQIKYELFRSANNTTFAKVGEVTAATDSLYNFQLPDAVPPAGSIYYYYLQASKAGLATHTTETIQVSSAAALTTTGTPGPFAQYQTGASAVQTYALTGANLTASVTITPPAGYEISANGGASWTTAAAPLVLTPASNPLTATISVRLNATAAGSYAGSIAHVSTGSSPVNVAVTGTRVNTAAPVSGPLQWWPLRAGSADSSAVRSAVLTASTPVFRNLTLSNGTTVPTIRAYSSTFGQAFGTTANGDGQWGTAVGGPGGNLSRRFYEQFTVTAAASATVRLDSLLLTSAFYNTSSSTRLAVVYSRSGFTADSADVTGGSGPAGGLLSTANGGFLTPILLSNQTTGPTNTYRLTLNGPTGLNLTAGQTLTIRLYFSCGSTSNGRYALLKNVVVKGENTTVLARRQPLAGSRLSVYPNPTTGRATVELSGYTQATELSVCNAVGRQVLRLDLPGHAGIQQAPLDLSRLPAGVYLLRTRTADGLDVRRILKY